MLRFHSDLTKNPKESFRDWQNLTQPARDHSPPPPKSREELIHPHIYIKSNYVVIRSFWCRDNFFWGHQLPFTSASTTNHQWQRESSAHSGWKLSPSGTLNGRSFVFRPQASFNVPPPPPPPRKNRKTFQPERNPRRCSKLVLQGIIQAFLLEYDNEPLYFKSLVC